MGAAARLLFRALLGQRLPTTTGVIALPGLAGEVSIRRDRYGIPHIDAADDHDAWFALGFCVGQDRSFAAELQLRVARGTMSALVGRDGVAVDRLARRIGFRRAAEAQLAVLDTDVREQVQAFADGVNAGRAHGSRRQAHEFTLLRARPTRYEAADVVALLLVESCVNAMNWDVELARLQVLRADGADALIAVDPEYPAQLPVTAPPAAAAGPATRALAEDLAVLRGVLGGRGGSNNWVLAGSRTTSGRPLLAGDPHLPNDLPPIFYLAHIRTPEWEAAGVTIGPAFVAGHNGHAAWAETNGYADNSDLFVEELSADGRSVRRGDHDEPCESREEPIEVRGGATIVERVVTTSHGPVIGPALDVDLGAIALRATWLQGRPGRGVLAVHRARSFEAFRRCFDPWPAMSFNYVYADVTGTIGWQLTGDVPQRRSGHGLLPVAGADPDSGWLPDPVPFDAMPHAENPDCGFLATANNKPIADDGGPFLGADWVDGFRVRRIIDLLASRQDWDVLSTQAMQVDVHSTVWDDIKDVVLAVPAADADARTALDLLTGWNGAVDPDSSAAAIFLCFMEEIARRLVTVKAPHSADVVLGKGASPLAPVNLLVARRDGRTVRLLLDQPDEYLTRPWPTELADTLSQVVRELRAAHGPNPRQWTLRRDRPLVLRHPFGRRRPLDRVFQRGPLPVGGDANTIWQCSLIDPATHLFVIPAARVVIDVGDWNASRYALPGGQSGNPLSPHYDDLLPRWLHGTGVPIAWEEAVVAEATTTTLRLQPVTRL